MACSLREQMKCEGMEGAPDLIGRHARHLQVPLSDVGVIEERTPILPEVIVA